MWTNAERFYMEICLQIWSIVEKSDLRDSMVDCAVNWFGPFSEGILANITVTFVKTADGDPSTLPTHLQEILLDSLRRSERRLGESHLFVGNLLNAVPGVQDINECISGDLNDCNASAVCSNMPGSYMCTCKPGYADRHGSDPLRSGRTCEACEEAFCSQRGVCLMGPSGKTCQCNGWHLGVNCQTDGQVVAVACGSCALAVILIAIALIFLLRWRSVNSKSSTLWPGRITRWKSMQNKTPVFHKKTDSRLLPKEYFPTPNVLPGSRIFFHCCPSELLRNLSV